MSVDAITELRQAQIRQLRPDWLDVIEDANTAEGAVHMTVWPEEETIYFGTDEEFEAVVKQYNLDHKTTGEERNSLWNTY